MSSRRKSWFPDIPSYLVEEVMHKLRITNALRVYIISISGLVFAFLVLYLDYVRYQNGKIEIGNIYYALFVNHLGFFLFLVPIFIIYKNRIAFTKGTFKNSPIFFYSWAIFLGAILIAMSILTLIDRSSLTMYYIYMIIVNFGLLMKHRDRVLLNLVSFAIIQTTILYVFAQNKEAIILNSMESLGVTGISFIVSTTIFNVTVRQIAADRLVEEKNAEVALEKQRADELLNNILPEDIANELKETGKVIPRQFPSVSIMMLDFKDFSIIAREMTPVKLVGLLDFCFKNIDRITAKNHLEKIKTIGDAYLCVGGLPEPNNTHANDAIQAAKEILSFLQQWKMEQIKKQEPYFEARIGIHTGEVVAGVVGDKKFAFDVWGDAVNMTARVESAGEANQINISQTTYDLVKKETDCTHRGKIPIKNGMPLDMYFVNL